jgi:hypothetical protein
MKRAVFAALLAVSAAVAPVSADLSQLKIFPNPFRASRGDNKVTFANLSGGGTIKIFNVAGHEVFEKSFDASVTNFDWNVKNNNGDDVASGVYIYFIDSGGDTRHGKLGILR